MTERVNLTPHAAAGCAPIDRLAVIMMFSGLMSRWTMLWVASCVPTS